MKNTRTNRGPAELRPIALERNVGTYAEGSCLISAGRTRVLCTASVQESVPDWRRESGAGWLTAEYAMLPRATHTRTPRERGQVGGRTQEIQRLIGRALRAGVDLQLLGPRTVTVDCDVLSADGGTRTAAITGAAVAVFDACSWLLHRGLVARSPFRQLVAAVSVGVVNGETLVDLEYVEDVRAEVDCNFVALESGEFVEVQGTGEKGTFSRSQLDRMLDAGADALRRIFALQHEALGR